MARENLIKVSLEYHLYSFLYISRVACPPLLVVYSNVYTVFTRCLHDVYTMFTRREHRGEKILSRVKA